MNIEQLKAAQKEAKERYTIEGPTHAAVARCEIIFEMLKERGI